MSLENLVDSCMICFIVIWFIVKVCIIHKILLIHCKVTYHCILHVFLITFGGDTDMTSTLKGGGDIKLKWDKKGRRGVSGSECCGRPISIFFIKESWICAMTRHHAGSNINILLTRNLPFDSDVRQWSGNKLCW